MKKTSLFLALSIAAFQLAEAQKKIPNPTKYGNTITAEELKEHLYIVAGAEMEGRMTASEGERKAAAYLVSQFKAVGLIPGFNGSYYQPYSVYYDSVAKVSLSVNGQSFDNEINGNLTGYTASFKVSDFVFYGDGNPDAIKDLNVRGKVVLINPRPEPPAQQGQRRMPAYMRAVEDARQKGAAAVLIVSNDFQKENNLVSRVSGNAYKRSVLANVFSVSPKAAAGLLGNASLTDTKPGAYPARIDLTQIIDSKEATTNNVMGYIEGTDKKDEFLFITAHYDHDGKIGDVIWFGADDDGSGTVTLLELAEAFAQAKAEGKGPRRSIAFMAVSGEERGLLGSYHYSENPVIPVEKTTVNLNIDMIGRRDPDYKGDSTNYIYVVGDDKISSESRGISEAANKKYAKLELDYKFNDPQDPMRIYYRSDHYNFARKGVPIIFYFSGLHPDYHRPSDTPDKIDYVQMAKRAKLIFYTAWEIANRNEMLKRDIPLDPNAVR